MVPTAQRTISFIDGSKIQTVKHPPYSPDLTPCDYWFFPTIKQELRGRLFATREEFLKEFKTQVAKLDKQGFQRCFDSWLHRMRKCIVIGGDYVEKF